MMGEKDQARREMAAAGVPVVPGSQGIVADEAAALSEAARIKYPVILKASAGGGGRGMRVVRNADELPAAFSTASNEAQQAFGVPDMYIEKFIERNSFFQMIEQTFNRNTSAFKNGRTS
jgi:acetyl-CoA carboxylase biotin carboxylase subunit